MFSENTPSYHVKVTDTDGLFSESDVAITFTNVNDKPLLPTNTLTIGDDGDNIIIAANNWDVNAAGQITAATDETINGIDISAGAITDVTGLTVNGNIIVSGFVDGVKSLNWIKEAGGKVINLLTKGSLKHCQYQLRKTPEQHFEEYFHKP